MQNPPVTQVSTPEHSVDRPASELHAYYLSLQRLRGWMARNNTSISLAQVGAR